MRSLRLMQCFISKALAFLALGLLKPMIASNLNGAIASKLHMRANSWPSCITLGVFQRNLFLSWSVVIPNTSTEFFQCRWCLTWFAVLHPEGQKCHPLHLSVSVTARRILLDLSVYVFSFPSSWLRRSDPDPRGHTATPMSTASSPSFPFFPPTKRPPYAPPKILS